MLQGLTDRVNCLVMARILAQNGHHRLKALSIPDRHNQCHFEWALISTMKAMAPNDFFSSTNTELCLSPMKFDAFPHMSLTAAKIHYTHNSLQFLSDFLTIIFLLLGLSIACTHFRDLEKSLLSSYMSNIAQTLHQPLFEHFQIRERL